MTAPMTDAREEAAAKRARRAGRRDDRWFSEATRSAFRSMLALTPGERASVLCWFCTCGKEVPPGRGPCCDSAQPVNDGDNPHE